MVVNSGLCEKLMREDISRNVVYKEVCRLHPFGSLKNEESLIELQISEITICRTLQKKLENKYEQDEL
jgi:hypothetical protein